jgi:hypothetical protein
MAAQGVARNHSVPKLWRWMWSLGIECPPPPFTSVLVLALICGTGLAVIPPVLWLYSLLRHPARHHLSATELGWFMAACFAVGAWVGPFYYRRVARKYGLVSWSSFRGKRQVS